MTSIPQMCEGGTPFSKEDEANGLFIEGWYDWDRKTLVLKLENKKLLKFFMKEFNEDEVQGLTKKMLDGQELYEVIANGLSAPNENCKCTFTPGGMFQIQLVIHMLPAPKVCDWNFQMEEITLTETEIIHKQNERITKLESQIRQYRSYCEDQQKQLIELQKQVKDLQAEPVKQELPKVSNLTPDFPQDPKYTYQNKQLLNNHENDWAAISSTQVLKEQQILEDSGFPKPFIAIGITSVQEVLASYIDQPSTYLYLLHVGELQSGKEDNNSVEMVRFHYSKNDLVQLLIDKILNTIVLSVNDYPLHPPVRLDNQKIDVNNLKFFVETFNKGTKLEFVV